MFKIFLTRNLQEEAHDNRRHDERFTVQEQHLLALGHGEILRLIDISKKGFSAQVSKRALQNLSTEKTYQAKLASSKILFEIKVAWKEQDRIGFELVNPSEEVITLFQDRVVPLEIARSLRLVNINKDLSENDDRTWYQGLHNTDLIIWRDQNKKLNAWQMTCTQGFVEWNHEGGIRTGSVGRDDTGQEELVSDDKVNERMIQLTSDIIVNFESTDSEDILPTLSEEVWDSESEREIKQEK